MMRKLKIWSRSQLHTLLLDTVIKCRPRKSLSLVKIDPIVGKIQPFENVKIYKEMYGYQDGHTFLFKF